MWGQFDGQNPPPAGQPSDSSNGYLSGLADQSGIPLDAGSYSGATGYSTQQNHSVNDPFIYAGTNPKITKKTNATVAENILNTGGTGTLGSRLSDLQRKFIESSNENKQHWAYLLALTGYAGQSNLSPKDAADFAKTASLQDVLAMHQQFLMDAADQFNLYKRKITPEQMMKQMLDFRFGEKWGSNINTLTADKAGQLQSGLGSGSGKTITSTQKSVDLMSNEDAKGLVRAMLQQELGRDPTQAEYEDFVATLHSAERANPSISKTTSTYDANGNLVNSSTNSSGGLSQAGAEQALYDNLRQQPSYGIWQAIGTYAPALFEALGAAVPGA